MIRRFACVFAACALALLAAPAFAQDAMQDELYGRGVHAYFARNLAQAHDSFTAAIKSGSRDARAYYYRGLVYARLGRPDEARADFRKGAELEMAGGDSYAIAKALERIQGSERMLLETHRGAARIAIHSKQATADQARYEEVKRSEGEAVRDPARLPPSAPPTIKQSDATDPFGGLIAPAPLPVPAPAVAPLPAPASVDPFPVTPSAPAATTPAAPAPAPAANDPFAAPAPPAAPTTATPPKPAAADPFAEPPAAAPTTPPPAAPAPAPTTPAPAPLPAATDPFAEPAAPAPTTPAPTAPAPTTPAPTAPAPAPPANDPFAEPTTPAPNPALLELRRRLMQICGDFADRLEAAERLDKNSNLCVKSIAKTSPDKNESPKMFGAIARAPTPSESNAFRWQAELPSLRLVFENCYLLPSDEALTNPAAIFDGGRRFRLPKLSESRGAEGVKGVKV